MTIANAQSKKEQIENLTFSLDSLNQVAAGERQNFNTTLDSLNQLLSKNQQDFELEMDKSSITINNLNNQVIRLNSINDSINVQLKTKDQKIDSLTLRVQNLLADINSLSNPSYLQFSLHISNKRESPATCISFLADYKIELKEGNIIIASFDDIGAGFLSDEKDVVYIRTDMPSERTYTFEKTGVDEVTVIQHFFFSDLDINADTWRKTYKKDLKNTWKLINCEGDCN